MKVRAGEGLEDYPSAMLMSKSSNRGCGVGSGHFEKIVKRGL